MASSFRSRVQRNLGAFPHFLLYAFVECLLIILLVTDGIITFLCNEIARYFELKPPCFLCTRIDHFFFNQNSKSCYVDSICEAHKMEVYDLAYGHIHKKEKEFDFDKPMLILKTLKEETDEKNEILRCDFCGNHPVKTMSYSKSLSTNVSAPAPSPRTPIRNEEGGNSDMFSFSMPKFLSVSDTESKFAEDENPKPLTNEDRRRNVSVVKYEFASDPNEDERSEEGAEDDLLTRLKTQVRSDRKTLLTLSMELEEERNASAVAAKNAMAMITRLQADKAAVQMEALQYKRMMEEQAEYDQEAMQLMKDMLFKRDEEINSLEFELEEFREKYRDINRIEYEDYQEDTMFQGVSHFSEKSDGGSSTGDSSSSSEADASEH